MKILELNFERTWRGGERQTAYNIQGFLEAGHEVALICRKGFPLEKFAQEKGWNVFSFDHIGGVINFLVRKTKSFDVLHAQTSHILTYCLFTKPFHGRKIVFSRRVNFVPKGWLTKVKYRLTDKIVAVSEAVRNIVTDFSGRKDIVVVSDIVMPVALNKTRAENFLREKKIIRKNFLIGTIAALGPDKDPMNMVEAIRLLNLQRSDFIFLHFGAGELQEALENKIREYGLEHVYYPLGFVENVEDFFSVFDVFVISSQEEGLGSSVLDAFLYKVPVAGTNAGGLNEILEEHRAVKVSKKSPESLANAINFIVSRDATFNIEMTAAAYEYVATKHSLSYITQQYLNIMR